MFWYFDPLGGMKLFLSSPRFMAHGGVDFSGSSSKVIAKLREPLDLSAAARGQIGIGVIHKGT